MRPLTLVVLGILTLVLCMGCLSSNNEYVCRDICANNNYTYLNYRTSFFGPPVVCECVNITNHSIRTFDIN